MMIKNHLSQGMRSKFVPILSIDSIHIDENQCNFFFFFPFCCKDLDVAGRHGVDCCVVKTTLMVRLVLLLKSQ